MKYKIKNIENQAQSQEKIPTDTYLSWSHFKKSIFNLLVHFDNRYSQIFPSQTCLAYMVGCSLRTVNRIIKELVEEEWLTTLPVPRKTSFYFLPSIFNDYPTRFKLASVFSSFRYLKLTILMVSQNAVLEANGVPSIKDIYLYKNVIRNSYVKRNTKTYTRKRESNMHYEIPHYVEEINEIPLTQMGKIRLSTFNETTISAARKLYAATRTKPRNPATWFIKLCEDYAKEHTLSANWQLFYHLKEQYGLTGKEPYLDLKGLSTAKASSPKTPAKDPIQTGSVEWHLQRCEADIAKYEYLVQVTGGNPGAVNALKLAQEKLARLQQAVDNTETTESAEQILQSLTILAHSGDKFEKSCKSMGTAFQLNMLRTFVEKPGVLDLIWSTGDKTLTDFIHTWYTNKRESTETKEQVSNNTPNADNQENVQLEPNLNADNLSTVRDNISRAKSDVSGVALAKSDNDADSVNIMQDYTLYEEVEDHFIDERVKETWSLPF